MSYYSDAFRMNELLNVSVEQLRRIAGIKERIELLQYELSRALGDSGPGKVSGRRTTGMSAAGRARIAAAQRARWAKYNAAKGAPVSENASKSRRKLSASARAKIAAAARARWAKARAAGKRRL
ncbi:MAG TPA: hypothetical protein VGJ73_10695 [Verrucomicrobiae bacterium]